MRASSFGYTSARSRARNRAKAVGLLVVLALVLGLAGCASAPPASRSSAFESVEGERTVRQDDLLTAGLGLDGLRQPAPSPAQAATPTADELRRIAIHSNYAGLTDRTPQGGMLALPPVPGQERHAWVRLPGRAHPARLMVQVPDALDLERPCLVVSASSGSRGIYGALPVAGPWALPRGCAFATTDKGAGTDLFDHAGDSGFGLDGTQLARGEGVMGFEPAPVDRPWVAVPHAHSGDHPEADWGRYTIAAARFGLDTIDALWPGDGPVPDVRVLAVGLSNGGGAVLRALEQAPAGLFDGAVVAAANVTPPGARPLYDYATEAALLQPCVLADLGALMTMPFANPLLAGPGQARCESLAAAGWIDDPTPAAARVRLAEGGFDDAALSQTAVNVTLDVWRSVAAIYASAYLRRSADDMPCGFASGVPAADGTPTAVAPEPRALWWAASSGVVPGAGVEWVHPVDLEAADPEFDRLQCLRALWIGDGADSVTLRRAVEGTRATGVLPDVPVIVLHGREDGLIPVAFSAWPYVAAARAAGARQLAYWDIEGAQHFDVLVPFPGMRPAFRPLLPVTWDALDHLEAVLDGRAELGNDRQVPLP